MCVPSNAERLAAREHHVSLATSRIVLILWHPVRRHEFAFMPLMRPHQYPLYLSGGSEKT